MNDFVSLFRELDETNSTHAKLSALVDYFRTASVQDLAYAIYFLAGNKITPTVSTRALRAAAVKSAQIPGWLFEETYEWVGDLAETVAAIVPGKEKAEMLSLADWVTNILQPIAQSSIDAQVDMLADAWSQMTSAQRFVMNKLLTGNFRVGVSQKLLVRAISQWSTVPVETVAHRMMGRWEPIPDSVIRLLNSDARDSDISRPYPFCLAHSLPEDREELGPASDFCAEWKWDGIRAQMVRRNRGTYLWSRGEETLHGRFPELDQASIALPDGTVLDGEILAWAGNAPLAFSVLQKRIQRKRVGPKLMQEAPVGVHSHSA
jgi:DNA ligase-1